MLSSYQNSLHFLCNDGRPVDLQIWLCPQLQQWDEILMQWDRTWAIAASFLSKLGASFLATGGTGICQATSECCDLGKLEFRCKAHKDLVWENVWRIFLKCRKAWVMWMLLFHVGSLFWSVEAERFPDFLPRARQGVAWSSLFQWIEWETWLS